MLLSRLPSSSSPPGAPQRADSLGLIFPLPPPANPSVQPVADGGRFSPPLSAAASLLLHAGHTQHRSSCCALSHAAFPSITSLPGAHKRYFCASKKKKSACPLSSRHFHPHSFLFSSKVVRQRGEESRREIGSFSFDAPPIARRLDYRWVFSPSPSVKVGRFRDFTFPFSLCFPSCRRPECTSDLSPSGKGTEREKRPNGGERSFKHSRVSG